MFIWILRLLMLLMLTGQIVASGSGPVLIKMGDKKGGKKGGNLILISGGKCGSPTLIKGAGKKGGSEMILVGTQNNCDDKKQIHVVKQLVPVPYYVPKPVIKYVLRHHYVPVRQVVMKPVPIPYPIKTYKQTSYDSGSYGGGSGGGSYENGGGSGYGSSTYDSEGAYSSGKYYPSAGPAAHDMSYEDDSSNVGNNPVTSNPSSNAAAGYQRQSYDSTPYSVSPTGPPPSMMMDHHHLENNAASPADYHSGGTRTTGAGYKSAATNSYFYESPKSFETSSAYDHYSSSVNSESNSQSNSGNYQLYAPVYSGPNGQLFTTNQVFNDTSGSGAALVSPVASHSSISFNNDPVNGRSSGSLLSSAAPSSSHEFLRIRESSSVDRSSTAQVNKKKAKSVVGSPPPYKKELERAKKLLTDQFVSLATISNGSAEKKK